jgi:bifunctional polynucleotide phosphatase/kinase
MYWPNVHPAKTYVRVKLTDLRSQIASFARKHPLELVIFCGSPGSGKSTYFWKILEPLGYERVNQDNLGSVCIHCIPARCSDQTTDSASDRNA